MTKSTLAATIAGALTAAALLASQPASAHDRYAFSFDTGNVRFAYSDGYWDYGRHWRPWPSAREAYAFRMYFGDRYRDGRHTRYPGRGWRDYDGDGVPDRYDRRPNNPWKY